MDLQAKKKKLKLRESSSFQKSIGFIQKSTRI